jgi:hypothetical protein
VAALDAARSKGDTVANPGTPEVPSTRGISRRRVLGGAGAAVAGGVALAAGGSSAVAAVASAADAEPRASSTVAATGPKSTTVVEFQSRITQSGTAGVTFASYGYLLDVAGAKPADLFTGAPSESTALFTAYTTGALVQRAVDGAIHTIDVKGTLTVYQRATPGASWDDPISFTVGTAVAQYAVTLQDVLSVIATATGLPTLSGDMKQTMAGALSGGLTGKTFGSAGQRLRFFASGVGKLTDPAQLSSVHSIAGNWSMP